MEIRLAITLLALLGLGVSAASADVGDPQTKTDHPWYPGELSCSTFPRLFKTQAELYRRVVGRVPETDEDKALASLLWRLTHYWHGEEGQQNLWGKGFTEGGDLWNREYWSGLHAHGFGICGTSHSQWVGEMHELLGFGRGRMAGVPEHSSFDVFLTGGPYGQGKWVLLDHDISTVIWDAEGKALQSIPEIKADLARLADPKFKPERQHGWPMCSYNAKAAAAAFREHLGASPLSGYAGPPPKIHLRRGETLRRYLKPGLEDGKTFVFWGRNYMTGGVPGPERWGTWVNQPQNAFPARPNAGYYEGQARYANAVYTYAPEFKTIDYREGVVDEGPDQVTFDFQSPYVIAATPATNELWSCYESGGRNGLVLRGNATCNVSVSVDRGRTWKDFGPLRDGLDLTDSVKGFFQYRIRFGAGASVLARAGLEMRTVCQCSVAIIPRLKDGGSRVEFEATRETVDSVGPPIEQARTHVVAGAFDSPEVTLELKAASNAVPVSVYATGHILSWANPNLKAVYSIDLSTDGGISWRPMVENWRIPKNEGAPDVRWSQAYVWGSSPVSAGPVRVRFRNDRNVPFARAELHLVTKTPGRDATKVTFDWTDDGGAHREWHVFAAEKAPGWDLKTGRNVETRWVEYSPAPAP
jgi:hypothetical protein